jgi:hypothetical protein
MSELGPKRLKVVDLQDEMQDQEMKVPFKLMPIDCDELSFLAGLLDNSSMKSPKIKMLNDSREHIKRSRDKHFSFDMVVNVDDQRMEQRKFAKYKRKIKFS